MNPWSRAETGEPEERELFARRARALPPASLPALADVLRAADESREQSGARSRVLMGAILAAACFAATVTALPTIGKHATTSPHASIVPDDAGIKTTVVAGEVLPDEPCICEEEHSCTGGGAPVDNGLACFTPQSAIAAPPPSPACEAEMSCATPAP